MKLFKHIAVALAIGVFGMGSASAALRVIATTPDLADLVGRIGGDYVKVESLTRGTEDIHGVPQRPSFVTKLNRADAVVHIGLGAEHAFLPALLDVAGNPNLLPGRKGYIDCSRYVSPLEVPTVLSRTEGDQHPDGNPHYNIDPRSGENMARAIAEGLSSLDPVHADAFNKNKEAFVAEWKGKLEEWRKASATTKGIKMVSQHKDMIYLAQFLGMDIVGEVEPKPGIAPSPKHLEDLSNKMKQSGVKLVINEVQYSDKTSRWLSAQTGAKIAKVATMGGAFPDSGTYFGMIDRNIANIMEAVK
jgi:zinc/manganese transport system substrate-binding protein